MVSITFIQRATAVHEAPALKGFRFLRKYLILLVPDFLCYEFHWLVVILERFSGLERSPDFPAAAD